MRTSNTRRLAHSDLGANRRRRFWLSSVALAVIAISPGAPSWAGNSVTVGGTDASASYVSPTTGQVSVANDSGAIGVTVDTAIGTPATPASGNGVYATSTRSIDVNSSADINATGWAIGIDSNDNTAAPSDVNVTATGANVSTGATAVQIIDVNGAVNIDGGGSGTIDGADYGISIFGGSPDVSITDFSSIVGNNRSIYIDSNNGNVSIQGIGQVGDASSADDGIYVDAKDGGNINIGGTAAIGAVTGGDDGIETYTNGTGTTTIKAGRVTARDMGIYARGEQGAMNITVDGGTVEATNTNAIDAYTTTGRIAVAGTAGSAVVGDDVGIRAESDGGDVEISGFGTIDGRGWGIYALSGGGDLSILDNGPITAVDEAGIYASAETGNGSVTIRGNGAIDVTSGYGIVASSYGTGVTTIDQAADVTGERAIGAFAQQGGIVMDLHDATFTGTSGNGIYAHTENTGDISIAGTGGATVSGVATAIYADADFGNISIQGIGGGITSSTGDGIYANADADGNINIGDTASNGAISGKDDGIEAYTTGTGSVTIAVDHDVTGTDTRGIVATAAGSGTVKIDVGSAATVAGDDFGMVVFSGTGGSTVNNAGTIRNLPDIGAPDYTTDEVAFFSDNGATVLNNTGTIIGQVDADGGQLTFNNSGSWYAGSGGNDFNNVDDALNNSGTIYIRSGNTAFNGLESFLNTATGLVTMSYSNPAIGLASPSYARSALDTLTVVNLTTEAGAQFTFDFDAAAANNAAAGSDISEDGMGTADTIVVSGIATPTAGTIVNINALNGDATGKWGSVALIAANGGSVASPVPGGHVTDSSYYIFGTSDLVSAATAYHLVDDGMGGVYLQWLPNLTGATLGAFAGGDLSDPASPGSAIAFAASAFSGIGGIGGMGGLNGGGATGAIGDRAAFNTNRFGTLEDRSCDGQHALNAWTQTDGNLLTGRGSSGQSASASFGIERDLSDVSGAACGQFAAGLFGGIGHAGIDWATGSSSMHNYFAGGYVRYSSDTGFYATALGAVSWAKANLTNSIFASTADQSSLAFAGTAAAGYVMPAGADGYLDLRSFASYGTVDGNGFTDSTGIVVDGSDNRIATLGLTARYIHDLSEATQGFVGTGVKWAHAERSLSAFGTEASGKTDALFGSVAAGVRSRLAGKVDLDASVYSDFAEKVATIGGNVRLSVKF